MYLTAQSQGWKTQPKLFLEYHHNQKQFATCLNQYIGWFVKA